MKKTIAEFKAFIAKGNIVDMAVGVIIGGAFGKIVSSVVSDLFMPLVGLLLGGVNFSGLSITLGDATIRYGAFLQNIVDFLIIALCMFLVVKAAAKLTALHKKGEAVEAEPVKSDEVVLLEEIRDLLKEKE